MFCDYICLLRFFSRLSSVNLILNSKWLFKFLALPDVVHLHRQHSLRLIDSSIFMFSFACLFQSTTPKKEKHALQIMQHYTLLNGSLMLYLKLGCFKIDMLFVHIVKTFHRKRRNGNSYLITSNVDRKTGDIMNADTLHVQGLWKFCNTSLIIINFKQPSIQEICFEQITYPLFAKLVVAVIRLLLRHKYGSVSVILRQTS